MLKYNIVDDEGSYWTESKGRFTDSDGRVTKRLSFWSSFEPREKDKRSFFIIKALMLFLLMKMSGLKVTIHLSQNKEVKK